MIKIYSQHCMAERWNGSDNQESDWFMHISKSFIGYDCCSHDLSLRHVVECYV